MIAAPPTGYQVTTLDQNDPRIVALLNRYRRAHGLAPGGVTRAGAWFGLYHDNVLAVAFAFHIIDGILHVDEVCPAPGRRGIVGVYTVLETFKAMCDARQVSGVVGWTLIDNTHMVRAMRRVFNAPDGKPIGYVFGYGGK